MGKYIVTFLLLAFYHFIFPSGHAQDKNVVDSLEGLIKFTNIDTIKVNTLNELSKQYMNLDPDLSKKYFERALALADSIKYEKGRAFALRRKGAYYYFQGKNDTAILYYEKSLAILKQIDNKFDIANILNNLGLAYEEFGDYGKALGFYKESLQYSLQIKNKRTMSTSYRNIGRIYQYLGNFDKATGYYGYAMDIAKEIKDQKLLSYCLDVFGLINLELKDYRKSLSYYKEALEIDSILGNKRGIASDLTNIGLANLNIGEYQTALTFYNKALEIRQELNDNQGIGICINNIAEVYLKQKNYTKSIEYYNESLKIFEKIGNQLYASTNLIEMSLVYAGLNEYDKALDLGLKGMEIAKKINSKTNIRNAAGNISDYYEKLGKIQKALEYHKLFKQFNDSIFTEESLRKSKNMEANFEIERQQHQIELQKTQLEKKDAEISEQKTQQMALIGIIAGLFVIIGLILMAYLQKRKANSDITKQKSEIEAKNILLGQQKEEIQSQMEEIEAQRNTLMGQKESITTSIIYASRIQNALLPPKEVLEKILPEHFILFKPKDIVSGDFYWIEKIDNLVIIATVDCTGHGVPGAFMSMLGISFLNEITLKRKPGKASDILNLLRDKVKSSLRQTGKDVEQKDGMDLAICIIDFDKMTLQYSGAYNPVYIIREKIAIADPEQNSYEKYGLIELKADRQPISVHLVEKNFTNHEIALQKGDCIYSFSDGYVDQINGTNKKKFLAKTFKELLLDIHIKSMDEQKTILENTLEDWKNGSDQIDDVLVMGIRI